MPRRKKEKLDLVENLVKELETANEEIKEVIESDEIKEERNEVDQRRSELVRLS